MCAFQGRIQVFSREVLGDNSYTIYKNYIYIAHLSTYILCMELQPIHCIPAAAIYYCYYMFARSFVVLCMQTLVHVGALWLAVYKCLYCKQ